MKILTLTNLYPTFRSPRRGIFIDHRLKAQYRAGVRNNVVDLGYTVMGLKKASRRRGDLPASIQSASFAPTITPFEWRNIRNGNPSRSTIKRYSRELSRSITENYDLIHAHGMYGLPAGAVARELSIDLSIPYVVSLHGSDVNSRKPEQGHMLAQVLDGAAGAIFVSDALRERALGFGVQDREALRVIPNGIDPVIFNTFGAAANGTSTGKSVLYVGNLIPVKGADRLPEIFKRIATEIKDVAFTVIGDGALRATIEKETVGMNIVFLGSVDQNTVALEMAKSSLVVLPSRSEGWPTVILEAYACGTPVAASDVGGSSEAIAGFTPTVPDGDDFERRFVDVCLGALASGPSPVDLVNHASKYTWDAVLKEELDLYEQSIEGSRYEA